MREMDPEIITDSGCEYCGCLGHDSQDNNNSFSELVEKIDEYQEQNVMMFTRIMDRLGGSSSIEENDALNDIGGWSAPCTDIKQLEQMNDSCGKDKNLEKKLETRLRLCHFNAQDDIVRCMMSTIANDEGVWSKITWRGTSTKDSFQKRFAVIMKLMRKICKETFPETNEAFCDGKIKTFLRHVSERLKRKNPIVNDDVNTSDI